MAHPLSRSTCAPKAALVTAVACLLASCQAFTNPREASYLGECFKTAAAGGLLAIVVDVVLNKDDYKSGKMSKSAGKSLAKAAAIGATAGCAVGLAATAIGKTLDERERQKQDEAFQQAAQKGAEQIELERQQVAARYREMPAPTTEVEKTQREQEKAAELAQAGTKNLPVQSWSEGTTTGKVIVVGVSSVQSTGPSGTAEDCLELEETVTKEGREIKQRSTSCRNAETGGYDRVKVEAV